MVKLILNNSSEYTLDHRWIPETLFHYATSGSVERQEGSTQTFFYGDKTPEPHAITFNYNWIFKTTSHLKAFVDDLNSKLPNVVLFVYDDFELFVRQAFLSWSFGGSMNHLVAKLHLVPATISLFPEGLLHEYRFDDGPGSSIVTDYASGANGTIVDSPGGMYWNQFGLVFDSSGYVALPSSIGTTLTGAGWSQIVVANISGGALVGRSTSGTNRSSGAISEVFSNLTVHAGTGSFNGVGGLIGSGVKAMYLGRNPGTNQGVFMNIANNSGLSFTSVGVGTPYSDPAIGLGYHGTSTPVRLVGTVYYALYFNRYLDEADRNTVYSILKARLAMRGGLTI